MIQVSPVLTRLVLACQGQCTIRPSASIGLNGSDRLHLGPPPTALPWARDLHFISGLGFQSWPGLCCRCVSSQLCHSYAYGHCCSRPWPGRLTFQLSFGPILSLWVCPVLWALSHQSGSDSDAGCFPWLCPACLAWVLWGWALTGEASAPWASCGFVPCPLSHSKRVALAAPLGRGPPCFAVRCRSHETSETAVLRPASRSRQEAVAGMRETSISLLKFKDRNKAWFLQLGAQKTLT